MKPITKSMSDKEYMNVGAQQCPFCGKDDISTQGSPELDGMCAWVLVECAKCGKEWREVFRMTGWEPVRRD